MKTKITSSVPLAWGLSALVLFLQSGCAARPLTGFTAVGSPPISSASIANLGRVGIISTSTVPNLTIQRALTKDAAMAEGRRPAENIWINAHEKMAGQLNFSDPNVEALTTISVIPLVLPVSVINQSVGAIKGMSADGLEKSDAVLTRLAAEVSLQETLRQQVLQRAAGFTDHPLVLVKKPFAAGAEKEFSRMSCVMAGTLAWVPTGQTPMYYLASEGIDTALEIQLLYPALSGEGIINPPMAFSAEVRARLIRVQDAREVYACSMRYRGIERKFSEWASNNGQPLRAELERFCQEATGRIVEHLSITAWPSDKPMQIAASSGR